MSGTRKLYELASLAEASYALFDELNNIYSDENVRDLLKNSRFNGTFTATQAADFVAEWEVISHQKNTENGFSATLFRNKNTGEYVYATRGTEPGDPWNDLVSADIGDIVTDGLAIKQVVDMYNDWQRLTAATGESYQVAVLEKQELETTTLQSLTGQALQGYLDELRSRSDMGQGT